MQTLHLTNIIFSKEYTKTFLYTLPSQLANLEYLVKNSWPAIYKIYTTETDKKIMLNSNAFQKLNTLIQVEFIDITQFFRKEPHLTMTACHNDIILKANKEDAVIVFLLADIIFSNNVFEKICSSISNGKRLLVGTALRLYKENFITSHNPSELININPRELVKKALPYLHHMSYDFFWDHGPKIWHWTALICLHLNKTNILVRGFHLHPIFVWPVKKKVLCRGTFDSEFINYSCPDKKQWEILTHSDEGVLFELSTKKRNYEGAYSQHKIKVAHSFVHNYLYRCHMHFAQSKIYILSTDYKKSYPWLKTERKSDKIIKFLSQKYNNKFYRTFIWPLKEFKYIYYNPNRGKFINFKNKININIEISAKTQFLFRLLYKIRNFSLRASILNKLKKQFPNGYFKLKKFKDNIFK